MTRLEWKTLCRKTKWASGKKRLTQKDLRGLMDAQIALGGFKKKATFVEKSGPLSIQQILGVKE